MRLNQYFQDIDIICINLRERPDRKKRMNLQSKRLQFPIKYFTTKKHNDPKKGCLLSHLTVIKNSISKKIPPSQVMILEDDCKFLKRPQDIPKPPDNWDMLYFGGTVFANLCQYDDNWCRIITWTCHGYLINLQNRQLVEDILKAEDSGMEIDQYYIKHIHRKYNCYMVKPMMAIQLDGYSDIEGMKVTYDFMAGTLDGFRQPEHEKTTTGDYVLKLDPIPPPMLPRVSIITPTYHRRNLFPLAIKNFYEFNYPKEKLEWIVVDDSTNPNQSIEDLLPRDDKRIKYIKLEDIPEPLSIAHKRNIGCQNASHDYIVHMDDDDYYPKESITARIKILMKYKSEGIKCVGCSRIGIYDLYQNKSSIATDGMVSLSEATMAYTKDFWQQQQFNELEREGEYKTFIKGRFQEIMDIPYSFVICAISHKKNYTEKTKNISQNLLRHKDTGKEMNFYDQWDEETQVFMHQLRANLK